VNFLSQGLLLPVVGGAALGYLYHRVVGCRTGACPITARWWTSSGYGALMGYMLARG
jgi:hypothetical protein